MLSLTKKLHVSSKAIRKKTKKKTLVIDNLNANAPTTNTLCDVIQSSNYTPGATATALSDVIQSSNDISEATATAQSNVTQSSNDITEATARLRLSLT